MQPNNGNANEWKEFLRKGDMQVEKKNINNVSQLKEWRQEAQIMKGKLCAYNVYKKRTRNKTRKKKLWKIVQ